MKETAQRAAIATLVVGGILVLALALWELKLLAALLFFAFILAAAMRPTVEQLAKRGIPPAAGIGLHYVVLIGLIAGFLWAVVPRAIDQVDAAVGDLPATRSDLGEQARESTGIRHDILVGIQRRLEDLPSGERLVDPAVEVTLTVFEVALGIFFVLASAAYWVFERDRAEDLLCSLLPRPQRKKVRDTWELIDAKLGAYVRGQALLVVLVGVVLSLAFWAIGVPYWILLGSFAGIVEIVPVIGPIAAGVLAVGVGLTKSVTVGVLAGVVVLVQRQLEDYLIAPRILGGAVGLSPLLVMISVFASGILFGPVAVVLAIPAVAVLTTLVDVIVRDKDPAEEDVPSVLFPAKEAER